MSICTRKSIVALGLCWTCFLGNPVRGLENLKPLAVGHAACMYQLDDRNHLVLFWDRDYKIYCRTSSDCGKTWSSERRLTPEGAADWEPTALQDSTSRLWLLWTSNRYSADGGYDLEYLTSVDCASTWASHGTITTPDYTSQRGSLVEIDSGILAFWGFGRWVTTSDVGRTWSDVVEVVDDNLMNQRLYKAHDGRFWIAGWTGVDLSLKNSEDCIRWSSHIKVSTQGGAKSPAVDPDMGQDAYGNLVVVWHSQHEDPNNSDVWYSTSFDNGLNWEPPRRLTNDSGQDKEPSLALIDGALWVVWNSNRTGYEQVYAFELGPNPWDLDSDGCVDLADFVLFSRQWGRRCRASARCSRADFDKSRWVDAADLAIFAEHWLESTPWTVPDPWPGDKPARR